MFNRKAISKTQTKNIQLQVQAIEKTKKKRILEVKAKKNCVKYKRKLKPKGKI